MMEENLITYWPQIVMFVIIVMVFAKMKTEIDVLKDKVRTAYDLINKLTERFMK